MKTRNQLVGAILVAGFVMPLFGFGQAATDGQQGRLDEQSMRFEYIESEAYIDLDTKVEDLQALLGEAHSHSEDSRYDATGREFSVHSWPGLSAYVLPSNRIIQVIEITGLGFRTAAGLEVNDMRNDVRQEYGTPWAVRSDRDIYIHSTWEITQYLEFAYKDGKITSMTLHWLD